MTITITFIDRSQAVILTNVVIFYVRLYSVKVQTVEGWYSFDLNNIRYLVMERDN